MSFTPKDSRMFRPYPGELPWPGADPEWTRVAKLDGVVIGAYEIKRLAPTRFQVIGVWVDLAYRRRGLGAWLLGHAIGLAETKGGREIDAVGDDLFYQRHGFEHIGGKLRLTLTPE